MAQTLGVPTLTYAPFAFFNLINPVRRRDHGFARIGIAPLEPSAAERRPATAQHPGGWRVTPGARELLTRRRLRLGRLGLQHAVQREDTPDGVADGAPGERGSGDRPDAAPDGQLVVEDRAVELPQPVLRGHVLRRLEEDGDVDPFDAALGVEGNEQALPLGLRGVGVDVGAPDNLSGLVRAT